MEFLLLPLIGALIGWSTNVVAVRLLFRPHRPVKIPILGFILQGLLPRRRDELAILLGETVEDRLLSREELLRSLASPALWGELESMLAGAVARAVRDRIPPFVPESVINAITEYVTALVRDELRRFMAGSLEEWTGRLVARLDVKAIVEKRLRDLDMNELENLVTGLASRELRHIQILGAVMGFAIGLIQALALLALRKYGIPPYRFLFRAY